MELFVLEIANYLQKRDEDSLMKRALEANRRRERNNIVACCLKNQISPIEAVRELLKMDFERKDQYVIPIRYPESDRPDWVDIVEFTLPHGSRLTSIILQQEILEFYQQHDPDDEDRLTKIESSFDMVANKHGGTWRYLEQNVQPLEVE